MAVLKLIVCCYNCTRQQWLFDENIDLCSQLAPEGGVANRVLHDEDHITVTYTRRKH